MRYVSKERDEFWVKWKQLDGADEDWSALEKKEGKETRGFLTKARDTILQLKKVYEEKIVVERRHRNALEAQVIDVTGQVMNI